jgi:hypothetical protein
MLGLRNNIFRGLFLGLPIVLLCWLMVSRHPKSHTALVLSSCWFSFYTTVVLTGYFWPRKRRKSC